jgi:hypothetical protein
MSGEMIERVAKAIEDIEFPFEITLTNLIGGVATYTLWFTETDERFTFHSRPEAHAHYRARLGQARALAAVEALREPTDDMRLHGTAAGAKAGKEIAKRMGDAEIAVTVVTGNGRLYDAAWRAMIDAARGKGTPE